VLLPLFALRSPDDNWPSLKYLKSDYMSVRVVAHVRIHEAEIVNRIPGYDNWKISAEVIEPFKGKFRKGEVIQYSMGPKHLPKKSFSPATKSCFCWASMTREEVDEIFGAGELDPGAGLRPHQEIETDQIRGAETKTLRNRFGVRLQAER